MQPAKILTVRFITLCTTSVMLLGASECRFGNRVEKAAEPAAIGGYYSTEPQQLIFCADAGTNETCVDTNIVQVPDEMKSIFTNPIGLLIDEKTGEAAFINPFDGSSNPPSLKTFVNLNTLAIQYEEYDPDALFRITRSDWFPAGYSQCGYSLKIEETGQLSSVDKGKIMFGAEMSGRVSLDLQITRTFAGADCGATLPMLQACYLDFNACLGTGVAQNQARQEEVFEVYAPYVENGVMTGNQISPITARRYRIKYQ